MKLNNSMFRGPVVHVKEVVDCVEVAPFGVGDWEPPVYSRQEVMETIAELRETHKQELAEMNSCLYTFTDEELVAHHPEFFVGDYQWAFPKENGTVVLDDGSVYNSYEDFQKMLAIRDSLVESEEQAKLNYSDATKKRMMFRGSVVRSKEVIDSFGYTVVSEELWQERLSLSAKAVAIKEECPNYFEYFLNAQSNPAYLYTFFSIYGMPLTEEAWKTLDGQSTCRWRADDSLLMLQEFVAGYDDKLFVKAIVSPYCF